MHAIHTMEETVLDCLVLNEKRRKIELTRAQRYKSGKVAKSLEELDVTDVDDGVKSDDGEASLSDD
jgi:hypothetical protein